MIRIGYPQKTNWENVLKDWIESILSFAKLLNQKDITGNPIFQRKKVNGESIASLAISFEIKASENTPSPLTFDIPQKIINILCSKKKVKRILTSSCVDLEKNKYGKKLNSYATNGNKDKEFKLICSLFNYDDFAKDIIHTWSFDSQNKFLYRKKGNKMDTSVNWSRQWYQNQLSSTIKACPYCNLEYIECAKDVHVLSRTKPKQVNWQIDHFLSQADYPCYSISIYNLVPACFVCNSLFKGDTKFSTDKFVSPFHLSFHNIAHFEFDFTSIDCLSNPDLHNVIVSLVEGEENNSKQDFQRAENTCDFFGLKDRISQGHSDYICEIFQKCLEYPKEYADYLQNTLGISLEDVQRLIFGNYTSPKDINKRPLSKITIDMIRQYGHLMWIDKDEIDDCYPFWNKTN